MNRNQTYFAYMAKRTDNIFKNVKGNIKSYMIVNV